MLLLGLEKETENKLDRDDLEFQLLRLQNDMKQIAKDFDVIGVDQTKDDNLVIVYKTEEMDQCKIMLNDCESRYDGWDFAIDAVYEDGNTLHIGDIKGPANKGYGSICMEYLKETASDNSIPLIKGDIAKRDWDHVDRLIHFYEKHDFEVELDVENKCGKIEWKDF
jgi:GNAT superfamily N-acetyltransferase